MGLGLPAEKKGQKETRKEGKKKRERENDGKKGRDEEGEREKNSYLGLVLPGTVPVLSLRALHPQNLSIPGRSGWVCPTFKVKEEKRNGKKPEERGDNKTHRRRKE